MRRLIAIHFGGERWKKKCYKAGWCNWRLLLYSFYMLIRKVEEIEEKF